MPKLWVIKTINSRIGSILLVTSPMTKGRLGLQGEGSLRHPHGLQVKGWAGNRSCQGKGCLAMAIKASELLLPGLLNANGLGLEKP